ncbi:MAG TPA: bifunctional phosphoribosylaminoimidazolecarboxamide formyltransferase/IMP cyclohydrolase [Candidatus Saccharimonadales bacterium]|nr:bifunctional phosphoribosylaminoimidazolecarboxamide formyltransferase/IMP cyclohydrolase [Candidatus Saccharimonadales bacterium]
MSRRIERALVSVYDKEGIADLGRDLHSLGIEILSTGGTAAALAGAGVPVKQVSAHTGSPEILDGRVKTLHPSIHGGLLARRGESAHMAQLAEQGIAPIDMVVVNLYPFEATVAKMSGDPAAVIEMIDIGGPSMIRSAAKNHEDVVVLTDPRDYEAVLSEIRSSGGVSGATRRRLAARAFELTAYYDSRIADYLRRRSQADLPPAEGATPPERFPELLTIGLRRVMAMRYGENSHQGAVLYADPSETVPGGAPPPGAVTARQLQGKELSFNNIMDTDAAWAAVAEFDETACVVVKHSTPSGVAAAPGLLEAYRQARDCDPLSAFGGIVAVNRPLDEETAREITSLFVEVVIAPGYTPGAIEALRKKRNLRVMDAGAPPRPARGWDLKRVTGGVLVQDRDLIGESPASFRCVTKRAPTQDETRSLLFAWRVARHVKSNAIVYARGTRTVGIGAGQMSRVDSAKIGVMKASEDLKGAVMASDAFFPFRDGVDAAAETGVAAIIEPGGSQRDAEVIAAADEHGMAMLFTGHRHFRH